MTTTLRTSLSEPALIPAAQRLIDEAYDRPRWIGRSGYPTTGEAVALHADAAADLMKREAWDPQLYGRGSGRQLRDALLHTAADGLGDDDTVAVIESLLGFVLRAACGAGHVDYEAWSRHARTTLADVLAALHATAALARQHGPAAR